MKRIVSALGKLKSGRSACAVFLTCVATAIALPAQTLTTLFSFDDTDGYWAIWNLVQATNGDLYGTTANGGANLSGTVFKITLARISHRLKPRLRGGAASPEAGRAEDYSGYENRGEDRKMRSEMPMDGLCLLEDDGVDTRCLSALRSSSSGGRIGQVAELG